MTPLTFFNKTIDLKGDKAYLLQSYVKNWKRVKITNIVVIVNVLVMFFLSDFIPYLLYVNIAVFACCLPTVSRVLYYTFIRPSKSFSVKEVRGCQLDYRGASK